MGVDHCGFDTRVTEKFLNGADIIAIFDQVSGEGMPKRVTGHGFLDLGIAYSLGDSSLDCGLVKMMASPYL